MNALYDLYLGWNNFWNFADLNFVMCYLGTEILVRYVYAICASSYATCLWPDFYMQLNSVPLTFTILFPFLYFRQVHLQWGRPLSAGYSKSWQFAEAVTHFFPCCNSYISFKAVLSTSGRTYYCCRGNITAIKHSPIIQAMASEKRPYKMFEISFFLYTSWTASSLFNPIALRMAKTPWSFGRSECNRVKSEVDIFGAYQKLNIVEWILWPELLCLHVCCSEHCLCLRL